jgi:hypothetical protein
MTVNRAWGSQAYLDHEGRLRLLFPAEPEAPDEPPLWRDRMEVPDVPPIYADLPGGAAWVVAWLKSLPYPQYLLTEHWHGMRREALAFARYRCTRCEREDGPLDVHHRTYDRKGQERPSDLLVLCRPCHAREHGITPENGSNLDPS